MKPYVIIIIIIIIIIIGIQPLGRFGQRPELSQATGVALVRCILGKFLVVVCHYFPPESLHNVNKM
jgi:low affinity Fe/Cu permease